MCLPRLAILALWLLSAPPILAHEFWIEPHGFQVEPGDTLLADLVNGQNFRGTAFAWFDTRTVRSEHLLGATATPTTGRAGDVPALRIPTGAPGLMILVHETTLTKLTYAEWEKFDAFVSDKGLGDARALHAARDLPPPPFAEGYRRLVKSLVAVGNGAGSDSAVGLELELVALANPYTDPPGAGLPVVLRYQGRALPDTQVTVFARAPEGTVTHTALVSDANGQVVLPTKPAHTYLVDAVVLRPPAPDLAAERGIVWESLWTSLTFALP